MKPLTKMILTLVCFLVLNHNYVTGFAPSGGGAKTRQLELLRMVKNQKPGQKDWFTGKRSWMKPAEKDAKTKQEDAWVARDFNKMGEFDLDLAELNEMGDVDMIDVADQDVVRDFNKMGEFDVDLAELDEMGDVDMIDVADQDTIEIGEVAKIADVAAQKTTIKAIKAKTDTTKTPYPTVPRDKDTSRKAVYVSEDTKTMTESKDEWIARDMTKAGKVESQKKDWVADDMQKVGKAGAPHDADWVDEDMKDMGAAGALPFLKEKDKKRKSKAELIAEDMKKAGKASGEDWVKGDMETVGKAEEVKSWTNQLSDALDKQQETNYDDVYEDMEKAGKQDSKDWVAEDMKNAGMAESPMEALTNWGKDVTYKLGEWQKKAFNIDKIRDDMEEAGRGESRDWVARDLMETGRNRTELGRKYPALKKELADRLAENGKGLIAKDMMAEGKAPSSRPFRKDVVSGKKLEDMIAEDMKMTGTTSDTWITRDMEKAGHPDAHLNKGTGFSSHKQRETEEFKKARKVKMAPVVPKQVKPKEVKQAVRGEAVKAADQEKDDVMMAAKEDVLMAAKEDDMTVAREDVKKEEDPHPILHFFAHAAKKLVKPWKKWNDLE